MARTRGAKDSKPRKKPAAKGGPSASKKPSGAITGRTDSTARSDPVTDRPSLPPDDFKAAIAAELQAPSLPEGAPGPGVASTVSPPAAPASFDPAALTVDGLASAWQVPFWLVGMVLQALRVIPSADPVVAVGKRRAKDLARPSYEIYAHYAREYLSLNPDNSIHVAAGVTGLNAVGILPELTEAIVKSRREWLQQLRQTPAPQPAPAAGQ